jgi:hypothetical protein
MTPLILVIAGVLALLIARATSHDGTITRRPYAKRYGGAPGADIESKPDAR